MCIAYASGGSMVARLLELMDDARCETRCMVHLCCGHRLHTVYRPSFTQQDDVSRVKSRVMHYYKELLKLSHPRYDFCWLRARTLRPCRVARFSVVTLLPVEVVSVTRFSLPAAGAAAAAFCGL